LALASGAPKFSTLDRNRDGYISHDEARNAPEVVRTFADVDVDKNGKLDPGEYARLLKRLAS
jgi:Ca2+-binding EF-hand superfamily protein